MLIDGIKIAENSAVENLIVAKGDVFPAASQGELFYKTGEGQGLYVYNGTEWVTAGLSLSQIPYDIASSVFGKPANGDTIASIVAVRAFTVASGLAGSYAKAGTAATGSSVFTVYKNGASIGTFTFGANGTVASFAGAGASFAAGDVLTLIAPSTQDATLADIAWTLNGYLS